MLEIRRAEDIAPAFEALKGRAEALYVCADPLVITNRVRINTLALGARLPTMHIFREYVEAGGLMSYGANFPDLFRRAADYVDKILRGAKPADIPVEQPTKFDLVINLTTAKALGLDSAADAARPRRRGDRVTARNHRPCCTALVGCWHTSDRIAASTNSGRYRRHSGHAASSVGRVDPSCRSTIEFMLWCTTGLILVAYGRRPMGGLGETASRYEP